MYSFFCLFCLCTQDNLTDPYLLFINIIFVFIVCVFFSIWCWQVIYKLFCLAFTRLELRKSSVCLVSQLNPVKFSIQDYLNNTRKQFNVTRRPKLPPSDLIRNLRSHLHKLTRGNSCHTQTRTLLAELPFLAIKHSYSQYHNGIGSMLYCPLHH